MRIRFIALGIIGTALSGAWAIAGGDPDKPAAKETCPAMQARCPVSGDAINPKVFLEDKSGKVFFCCDKCIPKYKADPGKYAQAVKGQRIALAPEKMQVRCPVCFKGVKTSISAEHHDQEIYFCCDTCKAKFEKDPAKYEKDILARCYTTQVRCPVSGEEIDPEVSTTTKDELVVYFCCEKCIKRFEASPEKYLKQLALGTGAGEHPCEEEAAKTKD